MKRRRKSTVEPKLCPYCKMPMWDPADPHWPDCKTGTIIVCPSCAIVCIALPKKRIKAMDPEDLFLNLIFGPPSKAHALMNIRNRILAERN